MRELDVIPAHASAQVSDTTIVCGGEARHAVVSDTISTRRQLLTSAAWNTGPGVVARLRGYRRTSHMDAEYQAALSHLVRRARPNRVRSTLTALTFVLGPRRITRYLAGRARALADELARIDPPADAAAEHAALVRAARNASSELDELAARDDLRAFERFDAVTELKLGDSELAALEAKGYRLRA